MKGVQGSTKKLEFEEVEKTLEQYDLKILGGSAFYKNIKSRITVMNKEGYLGYQNFSELRYSQGSFKRWHKSNPYSLYNIKLYLKINKPFIELSEEVEEYKNKKTLMKFKCLNCGKEFEKTLAHLMDGNLKVCTNCTNFNFNKDKKDKFYIKTLDLLKEKDMLLVSSYTRTHEDIYVKDKEGYIYKTNYHKIKTMPKGEFVHQFKFHPSNIYTIDNIKTYIKNNNIPVEIISKDYESSISIMEFKCSCGETFKTSWDRVRSLSKIKCDICSSKKSSLEEKTENWLKENKINFENQYKFEDCKFKRCLPFDFKIEYNGVVKLIEVDGAQHYQPVEGFGGEERYKSQLLRDEIKNNYCIENNIPLLRLGYKDFYTDLYKEKLEKFIY